MEKKKEEENVGDLGFFWALHLVLRVGDGVKWSVAGGVGFVLDWGKFHQGVEIRV